MSSAPSRPSRQALTWDPLADGDPTGKVLAKAPRRSPRSQPSPLPRPGLWAQRSVGAHVSARKPRTSGWKGAPAPSPRFSFLHTEDSLTPSTLFCTLSPQYPHPRPALPVVLETWPRWAGCLLWGALCRPPVRVTGWAPAPQPRGSSHK